MAFITISIFEIIKSIVQTYLMVPHQRAFQEFFGQFKADTAGGHILIQADTISYVMKSFVEDLDEQLGSLPKNRLYKARQWINKNDMEGARRIREAFNAKDFVPPNIISVDRHSAADRLQGAFFISMGLGYTDHTTNLVRQLFPDWLRIESSDEGDAVELASELIKKDVTTLKRKTVMHDETSFTRLLPLDWQIDKWVARLGVDDYGVILRHTGECEGKRQINFFLGGFTEHGTYAAGDYLASRWKELWEEYVDGRVDEKDDHGDFLLLIQGRSPYNPNGGVWAPVPRLRICRSELEKSEHRTWCKSSSASTSAPPSATESAI